MIGGRIMKFKKIFAGLTAAALSASMMTVTSFAEADGAPGGGDNAVLKPMFSTYFCLIDDGMVSEDYVEADFEDSDTVTLEVNCPEMAQKVKDGAAADARIGLAGLGIEVSNAYNFEPGTVIKANVTIVFDAPDAFDEPAEDTDDMEFTVVEYDDGSVSAEEILELFNDENDWSDFEALGETTITVTINDYEVVYPDDTEDETGETGAWEFSDIAADNVTADEQAVFDKAMGEFVGVTYDPKDVIATQVVAGTNYAFLCTGTTATADPETFWAVVFIYKDLQGNAELIGVAQIDIDDIMTKNDIDEPESGSWQSEPKENGAPVSDEVLGALAMNMGVSLSPIAVFGTQVVAGTNYRMLCYGTTVTKDPVTNLYVVTVYEDLEGEAEITDIAPFDLLAYYDLAFVEPDDDIDESSIDDSSEPETPTPQPDGNPKTGALPAIAAVGALACAALVLTKKRK